jgi:CD2 antigen cytoplasmic tail-binding protein 2
MSSRFSAARPKRAGEQFARTHHGEKDDGGPSSSKKPKFDIRNPSALAPDAPEEDAILEADVIGGGGAGTKRGAVNLDGYDSDSENEGFDKRAEERAKMMTMRICLVTRMRRVRMEMRRRGLWGRGRRKR